MAIVDLDTAAQSIRSGGLVAFPTETVYGLGAHALNEDAVAQIFETKERPRFDPLIVHVKDAQSAWDLVHEVPLGARRLAEEFWPGPLTLVLRKRSVVPDLVTAGLGTVGLRVPDHTLARALLDKTDLPIAAPSANRYESISPTDAGSVAQELGEHIQILDGGPCDIGLESTVLDLSGKVPRLLRPGGVGLERLEAILGAVQGPQSSAPASSPGMSPSHYAPNTKLILSDARPKQEPGQKLIWIGLGDAPEEELDGQISLSPNSKLGEAARNLFRSLRAADAMGADIIWATPVPETGLGRAIMDRLRRASYKGRP